MKKSDEAAIYGETREYDHDNKKIMAYSREYNGRRLFVVGNFSRKTVKYNLPDWIADAEIKINNYEELQKNGLQVIFKPYQAVVLEVNSVDCQN